MLTLLPLQIIKNKTTFIVKHLSFVLLFTILYYITEKYFIAEKEGDKIKDPMTLLECFHFSLVTQTTVGYGHSYPTNFYSRIINIVQLLSIYGVLASII